MIRPFDWRDLALLHRLRNNGLCLDSRLSCTRGGHALQNALMDALTPGRSTYTLVDRPTHSEQLPVVGQVRRRTDQTHAKLSFIGPTEALTQPSCIQLLEALGQSAGESGAHHLIAEVDETSPAFISLRRTGYAIYARQRVWRFIGPWQGDPLSLDAVWRFKEATDTPVVLSLYLNLVPALVQQVEPPPACNGHGLVHWDEGELLGYLDIDRGPQGTWVQPYFHPAAVLVDDLFSSFLAQYTRQQSKPLYVCVRSYQGGLNESLERLGFDPYSDQAVMVKRLAALVRHPIRASLPALDGTQPEPTAPFAPLERHKPASRGT